LLQLRCKGWADEDVLAAGRVLQVACRDLGATFLLNDRADLAVALDADGVHVGQLDAQTAAVRAALGPDRILGRSTNRADQIEEAVVGADYIAFGPVFATQNISRVKEVQGLALLAAAREATDLPLVGIGGISAQTLPAVWATGADAWAVIGAIASAADRVDATRALVRAP